MELNTLSTAGSMKEQKKRYRSTKKRPYNNDDGHGYDDTSNEYLKRVQQKRKLNEQRLNELGLVDLANSFKKSKKRALRSANIHTYSDKQPTRRSARKANKPALYTGEDIDHLNIHLPGLNTKRKVRKSKNKPYIKKSHKVDIANKITPEQRNTFKNIHHETWVQDMKQYFLQKVGLSPSNTQRVLQTVDKLVNGKGIKHPRTQKYFKAGVKIQLHHDFHALLEEASEFVYENGGDSGHGWLVEHPVKKCLIYQHARFHHGSSFYKEHGSS